MNVLFLQRYNNYANRIIKRNELYIEDVLDVQASENNETFLLENVIVIHILQKKLIGGMIYAST